MKTEKRFWGMGLLLAAALLLGGCDGSGGGGSDPAAYTVGGTVEGLSGLGLVLQLNGGDDLPASANGAFVFPARFTEETASYAVTVKAQPASPEQTCVVTNGSGTLAGADVTDVMVRCVWTKQLGVAGASTHGYGVATDADGNVYVVGTTTGGLDGNAPTGGQDLVLVKYDAAGDKVYTRQLGVAGTSTHGYGVATDAYGNVYVTGYIDDFISSDLVLVKYNAAGVWIYTRQLGVVGASTYGLGVATDFGNVYVTGTTTAGLDGNALTGSQDLVLVKYDAAGNRAYTRQLGVAGTFTYGRSVVTDADGHVYVAGDTTGGLDGNAVTGKRDLVLVKYDAAGDKAYTWQLGVAGADNFGRGVATDAYGNVYVTGETTGDLDGNAPMDTWRLALVKYNAAGNKVYTRQLGVAEAVTYGHSVATDAAGNVYVAGETRGGLDGNALTGSQDLVLVKYNAAGDKQ